MKSLSNVIAVVFFLVITFLAVGVVRDSLADQRAKAEIAEANHIMYGLFSVNAWKAKLSDIIVTELGKLDLKTTTRHLKTTIENQLKAVIDKLNNQIREANKGSLGGRVKQMLIDLVVDIEQVKKGVPGYADAVIDEISKPESEKVVKQMAAKQLNSYLSKTFVKQNMAPVEKVLKQTNSSTVVDATHKLNFEVFLREYGLQARGFAIIGLAIFLFIYIGIPKNRSAFGFTMLGATLLVKLAVGVSIPMIDLEAKISELSFSLLGHRITFENQILYFQSKSIVNVFWLMVNNHDTKMKFVGVLLVLFSMILPSLKLISSIIFCYFKKARTNRFIKLFAFKTGKWSMADVLVIAILMSYIGFNGIIETQFNKMKAIVPKDITFFTTNGTTLQMGFYVFFSYALLAMVLTSYIKSMGPESEVRPER